MTTQQLFLISDPGVKHCRITRQPIQFLAYNTRFASKLAQNILYHSERPIVFIIDTKIIVFIIIS